MFPFHTLPITPRSHLTLAINPNCSFLLPLSRGVSPLSVTFPLSPAFPLSLSQVCLQFLDSLLTVFIDNFELKNSRLIKPWTVEIKNWGKLVYVVDEIGWTRSATGFIISFFSVSVRVLLSWFVFVFILLIHLCVLFFLIILITFRTWFLSDDIGDSYLIKLQKLEEAAKYSERCSACGCTML